MLATKALKMTVKSIAEIPILSQLYADSGSALSVAALASEPQATSPASDDAINRRIGYLRGDITRLGLDAIVNAANRHLRGGGGVDGAINAAAGPDLVRESAPLAPLDTGKAIITKGYNLPAHHVIHTVGPVYSEDPHPDESLASCYRESLRLAVENDIRTVAFSAISTGIYGFPSQRAAMVACKAVRKFMETEDGGKLSRVVFVTFLPKDVEAYNRALPLFFPPPAPSEEEQ